MATPGGLVDKQELIDAQLDTAHLGRVVNSKDASGAPITTSTNRTGGVNKTLDALEAEYQSEIDTAVVAFDDQRDQFETTFNAQFTYKRIGNISDYVGQSLPEADKLNSYQYPDDSDAWYAPIQGQAFPITIPADPTITGSGWVLTASPNIYRGLWPDTGGNANKGETWQTQVSGTPTGQYFTALQATSVDPVGDDVNWREVVSNVSIAEAIKNDIGKYTDLTYADVDSMIAGVPVPTKVGEYCRVLGSSFVRVSDTNGDISDFSINGNLYAESFGIKFDGTDETDDIFGAIEISNILNTDLHFIAGQKALITRTGEFNRVSLVADKSSGIVGDLSVGDNLFKPVGSNASFYAEKVYFEYQGNWNNNRPYVCSMGDGTESPLVDYDMLDCVLFNIGDSAEMFKGDHRATSKGNKISTDDNTDTYSSVTSLALPLHRYQVNRTDDYPLGTPRYSSYIASGNEVDSYGKTGSNQDIAKYSGMSKNAQVINNEFKNRNVNSEAEVDTFTGLWGMILNENVLTNVSIKSMKLLDGNDPNKVGVGKLSSVSDNILQFDEGAINSYGVLAKPDSTSYIGNKVYYRCVNAVGDFLAYRMEESSGANDDFGSEPSANQFVSNFCDIKCVNRNGFRREVMENIAALRGSIVSNNILCNGDLELTGDQSVTMSNNKFINIELLNEVKGKLTSGFQGTGNSFLSYDKSTNTWTDVSAYELTMSPSGAKVQALIPNPWSPSDKREWIIDVDIVSTLGTSNYQTFKVKANIPFSQTITQTSGRLDIGAGGASDTENQFEIVTSGGNYYVRTITDVTSFAPSVISINIRPQQ